MIACVVSSYGGQLWCDLGAGAAHAAFADGFPLVFHHHDPSFDRPLGLVRNDAIAKLPPDVEWVVLCDADDTLAPGYHAAMSATLDEDNDAPALLVPRVQYDQAEPKFWPRQDPVDGNWMVIGTAFRRDVFDKVGGFRDWPLYEDWDLFARMQMWGCVPVEVPDAVYRATVNPGSRNRAPRVSTRRYWHQAIGHSLWPDDYEALTDQDHARQRIRELRRIDKGRQTR